MKAKIQEKIDTNPDIWNAAQVAKYLKITPYTVYKAARKGHIPCTIIGSMFRFSRKKIEELV